MDFLRSFLRRHFAGKPVVASLMPAAFRVSGSASRQHPVFMETHSLGSPSRYQIGGNIVSVFCFSVVVNRLLRNWNLRAKNVDDTNYLLFLETLIYQHARPHALSVRRMKFSA